jgi:glycosyltransferase involved in cell wall biosynthesis
VFFGTYDERRHTRIQVLREGLATEGHDIVVCNVPLDLDVRAQAASLRRPWRFPLAVGHMLVAWVRLLVQSRRTSRPDVVVVGHPAYFDVHLAGLRWRRSRIVLDRLVSFTDTRRDRRLHAMTGRRVNLRNLVDRAASRRADLVVLDTESLADHLEGTDRHKAVVVPAGAPGAWFAAADRRRTYHHPTWGTPPMKVIFFGRYTPSQGATTVGQAIDRLAEHYIEWTMVGSGPDRLATEEATRGRGKVTWLDGLSADHLPELVAEHDVCLGIFNTGPKAQRLAPTSMFQGAAAGCTIVTSATATQREALGEAALCVPPGEPDVLAAVLAALAADPDELARRKESAMLRAYQAFTPAAVTRSLAARLAESPEVPF